MEVWEFVKALGSLGGLFSAGKIITDWAFRDLPLIFLRKDPEGGVALAVRNVAKQDIVISAIDVNPRYLDPSAGHETVNIVAAIVNRSFNAIVRAESLRLFPLMCNSKSAGAPPQTEMVITVGWRFTGSSWLPRPKRRLRLTIQQYNDLQRAK